MCIHTVLLSLALLASRLAVAADVAFIEFRDSRGKPIVLETGGRFAHVAIRVGDQWLHAHPRGGVMLSKDLSGFGMVRQILRNPSVPEPSAEWVQSQLGLPYDFNYSWDASDRTYCSKLVGQYLGLPPHPMQFDAPIWRQLPGIEKHAGEPGLSPDGVWFALKDIPGWERIPACSGMCQCQKHLISRHSSKP